ncbi:hypothetical protein HNR44_002471 [Geomicrobium halophilum]|uniref:DUF2529 domain-containing protein n=1 Tax=Geomicrobium halophilum TaxID=549000 RepID=A0A841Q2E0_9BACL|nr:DUF2529 family protein [Geomicrobium halophilum]MBB6450488.1 hypothetical protein [Geomicrobium halophilum]
MLKMYTTQLQRVFSSIQDQEEEIADSARLLAQALVGEGEIYVSASRRFAPLAAAIVQNQDTPDGISCISWTDTIKVTAADRLLILTNGKETNQEIEDLQQLLTLNIPLVLLGPGHPDLSFVEGMEEPIMVTTPSSPIVPALDGTKSGFPTELGMIYAYQAMIFQLLEIIEE